MLVRLVRRLDDRLEPVRPLGIGKHRGLEAVLDDIPGSIEAQANEGEIPLRVAPVIVQGSPRNGGKRAADRGRR